MDNPKQIRDKINEWAGQGRPFLFVLDYELQKPIVIDLKETASQNIFYNINGISNFPFGEVPSKTIELQKFPVNFEKYKQSFELVMAHLQRGDSFLINLTQATGIALNMSLQEVFEWSRAKYQLYFQDKFVTFSPEIFVKIRNGVISAHPMKGTISAEVSNAEQRLLTSKKEMAEHNTIVDLIRNDLSMVAEKVWVERFRYIDKISTHTGNLLQVSSEICGQLPNHWQDTLGDILWKLLPAGSVTGAPKPSTLQIIKKAENYYRGYYTGVFGIFDGQNVDSGVMIRFIENTQNGLLFKSGGGITTQSIAADEYKEMIDKIYIPLQ